MEIPAVRKEKEFPISRDPSVKNAANGAYNPMDIARLAYSYWEARGYHGGSAEEDWLRAEKELASRQPEAESQRLARKEISREKAPASRAAGRSR